MACFYSTFTFTCTFIIGLNARYLEATLFLLLCEMACLNHRVGIS